MSCIFCPNLPVATTNSSTPNEAFPFLCAQLGVSPSLQGRALCAECHPMWEEVSVLYSNMKGLVTLMGRRVGQLRHKLEDLPSTTANNKSMAGKTAKRKRKEAPVESGLLNWWYPSTKETESGGVNVNDMSTKAKDVEENGVMSTSTSTQPLDDDVEIKIEMVEDVEIAQQNDDQEDPLSLSCSLFQLSENSSESPESSSIVKIESNAQSGDLIEGLTIVATLANRPRHISLRGYLYTYHGIRWDRMKKYWICNRAHDTRCRARLQTANDKNDGFIFLGIEGSHNHLPTEDGPETSEYYDQLGPRLRRIRNPSPPSEETPMQDPLEDESRVQPSASGGVQSATVSFRGYSYSCFGHENGKKYWRCVYSNSKGHRCWATLHTTDEESKVTFLSLEGRHTHGPQVRNQDLYGLEKTIQIQEPILPEQTGDGNGQGPFVVPILSNLL